MNVLSSIGEDWFDPQRVAHFRELPINRKYHFTVFLLKDSRVVHERPVSVFLAG